MNINQIFKRFTFSNFSYANFNTRNLDLNEKNGKTIFFRYPSKNSYKSRPIRVTQNMR